MRCTQVSKIGPSAVDFVHLIKQNLSSLMKKSVLTKQKLLRLMRLSLVQFCIAITFVGLALARDASAQELLTRKITIQVENGDIFSTLGQIEKQADVKFTYLDNLFSPAQRISFRAANEPLETVLDKLLGSLGIRYRVFNNQIVLSKSKNAGGGLLPLETTKAPAVSQATADKTVSGTVNDENGEPLIGVSVAIKGTNRGTTTNSRGEYQIVVPDDGTVLVFSFVGYAAQEMLVGTRSALSITLVPENKALEEVVVVGFGTQKKSNLTGAVATIDSKALADRPIPNAALGLQGVSPGLTVTRISGQPGDDNININIRGASSTSPVPPLVVVDGVIVPAATLQSINPADIDNISILKDAASTAIYGVDGAGGVILVTTKKGQEGKVRLQYTGLTGIDYALSVPSKLSLEDEAAYSNLARTNSGQTPEFSPADLENIRNNVPYIIDPNNPSAYRYYNKTPIPDQLLDKTMRMISHSLSASGGGKNMTYLISGGYYYKDGVLKYGGDDVRRYNLRSNVSFNLSKYLSLDTRLAYTNELARANPLYTNVGNLPASGSGTNGQGLIWEIYRNRIQNPVFTPDGRINANANGAFASIIDGGYNNTSRNILDAVATLRAQNFVKGLSLRAVVGVSNRRIEREIFRKTVQRWLINTPGTPTNATNSMDEAFENQLTRNLQFLADYDLTINKVKLHLLAGTQYDDFTRDRIHTWGSNLLNNDLPTLNLAEETTKSNAHQFDSRANLSGLYRINFSYDDRFLFETSGRYDGSSRLSPERRYQFFPSVSAGWNLHREAFWSGVPKFINEFKIRGSYGQTGAASNIGSYDYLNLLERGTNVSFNGVRSAYMAQYNLPSELITWETIKSLNVGFNLGLFRNRLQVDFDRFNRTTNNLLVPLAVPGFTGILGPNRNDGQLNAWGWELEMRWQDRRSSHFNYSWSVNFSDNNNEVVRYLGRNIIKPGNNTVVEGLPLNTIWGLRTDGFFQTPEEALAAPKSDPRQTAGDVRYLDLNGDGRITIGDANTGNTGDFVLLGNSTPRYNFGTTFQASYKAVDFQVFIQGVGRREIMANIRNHMPFPVAFQYPLGIHADYWTPENPDALFPRPFIGAFFNYWEQDRMVLNAAYARLKNLQIGYTLPQGLSRKLRIEKARVFLSGQDLFVLSGLGKFREMYDPETRTDANAAVNYPSVNGANLFGNTDYPFFSTVSLGLNINL
jgi:TonB-linked SusC/RagA family outer membrane protein